MVNDRMKSMRGPTSNGKSNQTYFLTLSGANGRQILKETPNCYIHDSQAAKFVCMVKEDTEQQARSLTQNSARFLRLPAKISQRLPQIIFHVNEFSIFTFPNSVVTKQLNINDIHFYLCSSVLVFPRFFFSWQHQ